MRVEPEPRSGVEDDLPAFGHVKEGVFEHRGRLDGRVLLETTTRVGA
jgi:hypothetical protein